MGIRHARTTLSFVVLLATLGCGQGYYDTVVEERTRQLTSEDAGERAYAAWSIGKMGARGKSAVPALARALADPEAEVRSQAAAALQAMGRDAAAAAPALIALLQDADAGARGSAASALGAIGAPEALAARPDLMAGVKDNDPDVRASCAWALGELGTEARDALGVLTDAMADPDPEVRRWAARAVLKVQGQTLSPRSPEQK
jgi:HEAT repeat protein